MRRAKIVATLGPATDDEVILGGLIEAGLDVARLNMSHGDRVDHARRVAAVRRCADAHGRAVAILVDLQGPKIRIGRFAGGPITLTVGAEFTLTTEDVAGDVHRVSTSLRSLPREVGPGDRLLLDDGRLSLLVTGVGATEIRTRVIEGGVLSDNKGINIPGARLSVPALSEKDADDCRFALAAGADLIALSFVRSAADVLPVHAVMDEVGRRVPVIAKIEKPQAVDGLGDIVDAFDGIMIARGDLGVEVPLERVPLVQKRAIALARTAAKPVIVATQMLDSMMSASRPTRAEVSDVANAVLDGADALMLSGETSVGVHPLLVVRTMARIIEHVEQEALAEQPVLPSEASGSTARALTRAAVAVAAELNAECLVPFTETGRSARLLARHRSATPIVAFATSPEVCRALAVVWGVTPLPTEPVTHTDEMVAHLDAALLEKRIAAYGALVVVVAGVPPGIPGTTNGMRVHTVGFGAEERHRA